MTNKNFNVEIDRACIALITCDMPGRTMNVLSEGSMGDMGAIIEQIAGDDAIKGAVLTSGKSAFCAGADLSMMGVSAGGASGDESPEEKTKALYENNRKFNLLIRKEETCGNPIADDINDGAFGGGLEVTITVRDDVDGQNPTKKFGWSDVRD